MKIGDMAILRGHLVDPKSGIDGLADLFIRDGKVAEVIASPAGSPNLDELSGTTVIDARGLYVLPGLVDMHVHLRTPGEEDKEDPISGGKAAAAGGFTTICAMPNTKPALDSPELVRSLLGRCERECPVRVLAFATLSRGNAGQELTDFAALRDAGAVGISDDAYPVQSSSLALAAFEQAAKLGILLVLHPEDKELAGVGSPIASYLAEDTMLARNLVFAAETSARLHVCHVSTATGVNALEWAEEWGVHVSAEATPHHLLLTSEELKRSGTVAKVNPPLRDEEDRAAVVEGFKDGIIDVIATDHAPHLWAEKSRSIDQAPSGIVGLETALGLVNTYLGLEMNEIVRRMSERPAEILALENRGHLGTGALGDVTLFEPKPEWTIEGKNFLSKAKFTPFEGWRVKGQVVATVVGGKVVHSSEAMVKRTFNGRDEIELLSRSIRSAEGVKI